MRWGLYIGLVSLTVLGLLVLYAPFAWYMKLGPVLLCAGGILVLILSAQFGDVEERVRQMKEKEERDA